MGAAPDRFPLALVVAVALVGAWGGSIRQAAVAAPIAVLAALLTHPQRPAHRAPGPGRGAAVGVVAARAPAHGVHAARAARPWPSCGARSPARWRGSTRPLATLALFLVPVAILTGWFGRALRTVGRGAGRAAGRVGLAVVGVVVVVGGVLLDRRDGSLLVGNSLQRGGRLPGHRRRLPSTSSTTRRGRWSRCWRPPRSSCSPCWPSTARPGRLGDGPHEGRELGGRGAGGTTPLTRSWPSGRCSALLGALAVNLAYRAIYDRYLIPVVIGLTLLALDNRRSPGRAHPAPAGLDGRRRSCRVLLLGVISAVDTQDLLDLRWTGGDRLVELGYNPTTVDAGFDWVGLPLPRRGPARRLVPDLADYPPATYDTYFPDFVRCAIVSGTEQAPPGYVLLDELRHHRLFGLRTTTAYLFGNTTLAVVSRRSTCGR